MVTIQGKSVFGGVSIGKLMFYKRNKKVIKREHVSDVDAEWRRFEAAKGQAVDQLKELYEKNVISMQYIKSPILKEMITKGEIVTDNKLLTKPEYQYFDYLLNNSEFSDGKAIRNRYIHDSIITDEKTMTMDYYILLKVMIMIIIKINDDCCLNEMINEEGDFYEL